MNNENKKITVQDIATLANVSVATVSRALSKPHLVSDKAREQVMQVVEKTGYTINEAARNLRRKQTDTIVILIPNIGNSLFSNVVEGIETVCAENHLNVLIADTQKASMSHHNARSYFSQNRVDGVIILDGLMPLDIINSGAKELPIVFAGEWNPSSDLPIARIDDMLGVRLAVEHLHQLNHHSYGQVTGPLFHVPGKTRLEGFHTALRDLGHYPEQAWIHEGDFSLKAGSAAALAWFDLPQEQRPTGIFCASDDMAFGFIAGLNNLGIKVPEEVSVVGYDDLQVAEYFIPALTTIHQPRRALGKLAANTLLSLINKKELIPPASIAPHLVKRNSTSHPPPPVAMMTNAL